MAFHFVLLFLASLQLHSGSSEEDKELNSCSQWYPALTHTEADNHPMIAIKVALDPDQEL